MPKNHVMLPALLAMSVLAAAPSLGLGGCGSDVGPDVDAGAPSDPGKKDAGPKDSPAVPVDSGGGSDGGDQADAGAESDAVASDVVMVVDASDVNVAATLVARSVDCLTCAEAYCSNVLEVCAAGGNAGEGPAAGTYKGQLCNDTLSCFFSSACSIYSAFTCYCASYVTFANPPYCEVGGPCQEAFERSMESTSAPSVAAAFADSTKAGTRAMNLLNCLQENRCRSCFPAPPEAGPDADPDVTSMVR
jgi:hypothetical protein